MVLVVLVWMEKGYQLHDRTGFDWMGLVVGFDERSLQDWWLSNVAQAWPLTGLSTSKFTRLIVSLFIELQYELNDWDIIALD